ncbi:MAG: hypothetical protein ABA06_02605 [Parcubacteria bacterium C7867-001]|nr:MAG: hypothetical protein ABA06_02605 [Parcubacteria bacterium C7867-001]
MTLPFLSKLKLSSFSYGEYIHPLRDWFVLLIVSAVLLVASVGWNVWLFYRVLNGESLGSATASTTPLFDTASLSAAQTVFDARAVEEERYKKEYRFIDPSR